LLQHRDLAPPVIRIGARAVALGRRDVGVGVADPLEVTLGTERPFSEWLAEPARGDVVAIRLAGPHMVYVKRIVGLPGERLAFVGGVIHINGVPLSEPYVKNQRPWDRPEVTLGAREYFAVGDNRGMEQGAHKFGIVDRERILGKVLY
jgi:signal peptidase I